MRNNYIFRVFHLLKINLTAVLIVFLGLYAQSSQAQTLYRAVSASQIENAAIQSIAPEKRTKCEGDYQIKDGQLEEIQNFKFILQSEQLKALISDSLISNQEISFEQTKVMVLPVMGMIHLVGTLNVGGIKGITSFQLGFTVNEDESITFTGTKLIKMNDFIKDTINVDNLANQKDELKLDINLVLKNNTKNLAALIAK